MYFSKFTRKQRKKIYIKSQQQSARKQRKKIYIKSQQQSARKQSKKKSIKSFLLPKRSNKTESKSTTESTIDSIISHIAQKNISADEKIQMICDELSQLKTIVFYGVLTLPHIKSKVSKGEYNRGQTIGGMIRRETNEQKLERLRKELTKINDKIDTTELNIVENDIKLATATIKAIEADEKAKQATPKNTLTLVKEATAKKQTKQRLEAKHVNYKIELIKYENEIQALSDEIRQLDTDAIERRRQEADAMIHAENVAREVDIINRCLERYRLEHVDFNNLLQQIRDYKNVFIEQIKAIDSHFEHMTSNIVLAIKTKLENINKTNYERRLLNYKIARQGLPQYQNLERKLEASTIAVNRYKALIRGLPAVIAPTGYTEDKRIKLRCDNQFIITDADCDKVFLLVQDGKMSNDSGHDILDVWLENTRRMIELEKELFSKGYKGSAYLTNYNIYKEEFEKIEPEIFTDRLNIALENSPTIRGEHIIVKSKQLAVLGVAWFFCSNIDEAEARRLSSIHQARDNFHFTAHLDPGDVADRSDLPSRNTNKYSSGSLHLTGNDKIYKANMRPYIFKEDKDPPPIDGFVGLPRCIQILPVYPGDARETSDVIYVGRIVTDTLNTYLKELAIDSQKPIKEQEHNDNFRENTYNPIITELQKELPKQVRLGKKQRYLANIQRFEETLVPIREALQNLLDIFRQDDDCKIFFQNIINESYQQTLTTTDEEINKKRDKFKHIDEQGMDRAILVKIARQGVILEDVFPLEIFPAGGRLNLNDIADEALRVEGEIARGKYKRKKYTRKRLNKVSKKKQYKILRKRTNKYSIYKIKSKINKNKQK
jgi:hypothetical protein